MARFDTLIFYLKKITKQRVTNHIKHNSNHQGVVLEKTVL